MTNGVLYCEQGAAWWIWPNGFWTTSFTPSHLTIGTNHSPVWVSNGSVADIVDASISQAINM